MSDDIDRAQEAQDILNREALDRALRSQPRHAPTVECIDCGETLNSVRRSIGACRCVECQTVFEKK